MRTGCCKQRKVRIPWGRIAGVPQARSNPELSFIVMPPDGGMSVYYESYQVDRHGAILAFIRGGAERSAAWKLWIKFVTGSIFVNKVKI